MSHRTQLILEEWQYDGIRAIAESVGLSLSSVVREAVSEYLSHRDAAADSSLEELRGLGHDAGFSGADHDGVLYGAPRHEPESRPATKVRRRGRRA